VRRLVRREEGWTTGRRRATMIDRKASMVNNGGMRKDRWAERWVSRCGAGQPREGSDPMSSEANGNREAFVRRFRASLERAEGEVARLSKTNTRLLVASAVSSAVATLVTGITAAQGPIIGTGIPGWRLSCIVAAVFGFATTLSVALNQQLRIGDRLSRSNECLGRLKFVDFAVDTGSRPWDEVVREYEEIVRAYPRIVE
jgi:hypothetical protein